MKGTNFEPQVILTLSPEKKYGALKNKFSQIYQNDNVAVEKGTNVFRYTYSEMNSREFIKMIMQLLKTYPVYIKGTNPEAQRVR